MDERNDVARLLAEYCHHADAGRTTECAELFEVDAEIVADTLGRLPGRAAIEAYLVASRELFVTFSAKHLILNSIIDVDGDRATADSDFVALGWVEGAWTPMVVGSYVDELRRTDRWRISRRTIVQHGPASAATMREAGTLQANADAARQQGSA